MGRKQKLGVYLNLNENLFASCRIFRVACTERLSEGNKTNCLPNRSRRGLKNSSAHEGDNVNTPEKSISNSSLGGSFNNVD
ncbi:MAG: hypothetical protein HYV54_01025 [Parcubacteria group bacterium]|nr:hypothetical protein [Parcubacteria group bacterium]